MICDFTVETSNIPDSSLMTSNSTAVITNLYFYCSQTVKFFTNFISPRKLISVQHFIYYFYLFNKPFINYRKAQLESRRQKTEFI